MSVINLIRKELQKSKYLHVAIFDKDEVVFYIWEREFPVCVNPITKEIFSDMEGQNWNISKEMIEEICVVMNVIEENMDEITNWVLE